MSRDYAKFVPSFWTGTTGRALKNESAEVRLAAIYLFTSPHSNMIGLYYLPLAFAAHELGTTPEKLRRVVDILEQKHGFCAYDYESEHVWVCEAARFQVGEDLKPGDKRIKGMQRELDKAPSRLSCMFADRYGSPFEAKKQPPEAPSKPLRSQEQEQEQDQEQDNISLQTGIPLGVTDTKPKKSADAQRVVDHYRQQHPKKGRQLKPGHRDWKLIEARLAEGYAVDDLKAAIDGNKLDDWHRTNPAGHTVEFVFRNATKVEGFIALARGEVRKDPEQAPKLEHVYQQLGKGAQS